jgi:hypothetical protein
MSAQSAIKNRVRKMREEANKRIAELQGKLH